jgi:hypothetical protein
VAGRNIALKVLLYCMTSEHRKRTDVSDGEFSKISYFLRFCGLNTHERLTRNDKL